MKKQMSYYMEKIINHYDFPGNVNLYNEPTSEFVEIYNKIYSMHPQHEKYRKIIYKKTKNFYKKNMYMLGIGFLVFLICCILISAYLISPELLVFSMILPFILVRIGKINEKDVENYLHYYKNNFLPDVVNHVNCNLIYENIDNIEMFEKYKEANFEYKNLGCEWIDDYIHGRIYNDNYIEIVNLSVYSKNDMNIKCFCGIFALTELNKNINCSIKIMINSLLINKVDSKVNLDSIEFEKYFDVYTDNNILSVRILTADIMEMLVDFYKKYKIIYEIYLKNNKLYFRFFTEDCFEPTVNKGYEPYKLYKDYSVLKLCTDLSKKFIELIDNMEI